MPRIGGQTALEVRASRARLTQLGAQIDDNNNVTAPGDKIQGGLAAIAAAAGPDGALSHDEVCQLPLTLGARFGEIFRDRQAKLVATATVNGAAQALTVASGALAGFAQSGQALGRVRSRLVKTASDLEAALADDVLGHLPDPSALAPLVDAYRKLLITIARYGDAATLAADDSALTSALQALLARQSDLLPADERLPPLISEGALATLKASSEPASALELLRDDRFAKLERETRERLSEISPDLALKLTRLESFHALPPGSRSHVVKLFALPEASPVVIIGLLRTKDFGKLASHVDLLEGLSTAPSGSTIADYQRLLESHEFAALSTESRALVLRCVTVDVNDAEARGVLASLIGLPSFMALGEEEKQAMLRYFGGTNVEISRPARADLATRIEELMRMSAADQQAELATLLREQPAKAYRTNIRPDLFAKPLTKVERGRTRLARDVDVSSATTEELTVDGRQVLLTTPRRPPTSELFFTSGEDVVSAIERLPPWSRRQLTTITVVPGRKQSDFESKGGFWTSMDCSYQSGHVRIFAHASAYSVDALANDLLHESAHALAYRHLGTNTNDSRWSPWHAAIAKDTVRPSRYAGTSAHEDFAEAMVLWMSAKGTSAETELRNLMPGRVALLEQIIALDNQLAAECSRQITAPPGFAKLAQPEKDRLLAAAAIRPSDPSVQNLVVGKLAQVLPTTRKLVIDAVEALMVTRHRQLEDLVRLVNFPGFLKMSALNQTDLVRILAAPLCEKESPIAAAVRKAIRRAPKDEEAGRLALFKALEEHEWALFSGGHKTSSHDLKVPDYVRIPAGEGLVYGRYGGPPTIRGNRAMLLVGAHKINVITTDSLGEDLRDVLEQAIASIPPEVRSAVKNATIDSYHGGTDYVSALIPGGWLACHWSYGEKRGPFGGTDFVTAVHNGAFELYEKESLSASDRARWITAVDADRVRAYGSGLRVTDFAHHAQLYLRVRGTVEEGAYRVVLGERFALLDEFFGRS